MSGFLSRIIDYKRGDIETYVEPFAGGAGAAIALLLNGKVKSVSINDLDPAVYCFWNAVTSQNERFLEELRSTPITMEEWYRQRDIYRRRDMRGKFKLGFAFYYLNRCNRSGIVKGGVIGGYSQSGNYKLDARFKKEKKKKKIEAIGVVSHQIEVTNCDGREMFIRYKDDSHSLIYLDPPYVGQGESLYLNALEKADHVLLASSLKNAPNTNWVLTYDYDDFICSSECYGGKNTYWYSLTYSAQKKRRERELLIHSDALSDVMSAMMSDLVA